MKNFFETPEQYQLFKRIWSRAVRSPQAKSYLEPCDEVLNIDKYPYQTISRATGVIRRDGWINSAHIVLYNMIFDKPLDSGFTDVVNPLKIKYNILNAGFVDAVSHLISMKARAETMLLNHTNKSTREYELDKFLKPLGGKGFISYKMLANLQFPARAEYVKKVNCTERDIKRKKAEMQQITAQQLFELYE